MHARLLADGNNAFQIMVIFQGQGDGDLVQFVFRKNDIQIRQSAQYLHPFVKGSGRNMIIQNAACHISPLRVVRQPVNVFLRRPGIPYQKYMFQIISPASDGAQSLAQSQTETGCEKHVKKIEKHHHGPGVIDFPYNHIQYND